MSNIFKTFICLIAVITFLLAGQRGWAQRPGKKPLPTKTLADTVPVQAGELIIFPDTVFIPSNDTVIIVPANVKVRIRENPYAQSNRFYDSLASRSYKNVITRNLHRLLTRRGGTELSDSINLLRAEAPFEPFQNYRIRAINIREVEVLSGSVLDTAVVAESGLSRAADRFHANTKTKIIRRSLLFKPGDRVKAYNLADNERILRELPFIRDSRILLLPSLEIDSVLDVYVITQDRLSLLVDGSFKGFDEFSLELGERSILGTGNQISLEYFYDEQESPQSGYALRFRDNNIRGTFISNDILVTNTWEQQGYQVSFNRNFITPETKWAGGVSFGDLEEIQVENKLIDQNAKEEIRTPFTRNFQDLWLGRSFGLDQEHPRNNISLASRVSREEFTARPLVDEDSNQFFHNRVLLINELGFTKRKFLKSSLILAFGITEDIPRGFRFGLLGGYEYGEFENRPYWGLRASGGDFWKGVGYFAAVANLGGYVDDRKFEDGVFSSNSLYFSPLLRVKRFQFRQFLRLEYTRGLKRSQDDFITLEDEIRGTSDFIRGDRKLSASLESVFFSPVQVYGFRLAAYAYYDFGWISNRKPMITDENFQYSAGLGVRIRNESLLFSTMQLRLGYLKESSSLELSFSFSSPRIFQNFQSSKPDTIPFD